MRPTAKAFFKRQVKEKNNIFFSEVRLKRAIEQRKKKEEYSWEKFNYKIYPSSLQSLYMCPKKFVEETVHTPPNFPLPTVYKMEVGKIVHALYQKMAMDYDEVFITEVVEEMFADYLKTLDSFMRHMYKQEAKGLSRLLWERPRLLSEELEKKLAASYPEVPGWDEASGTSFRSDLTLNYEGTPGVLDLKTTSIPKDKWEDHVNSKLPTEANKLQVRIYRHFFNKHNYYEKKVRWVGLGYINLLIEAGGEGSEIEFWEDLGEGPDLELEHLFDRLAQHRYHWINGRELIDCEYDLCREHGANS